MIISPPLVFSTILDLLLLIGLVRNNQQLHYLMQTLSIVLQFLLVKKFFGFNSYWLSVTFSRVILLLFGVITRVSYTFLEIQWSIKGKNILRYTCTSFTNSSKMMFLAWSTFLLKRKLLIFLPNLCNHLIFFSYNWCLEQKNFSLRGCLESSFLHPLFIFYFCYLVFSLLGRNFSYEVFSFPSFMRCFNG